MKGRYLPNGRVPQAAPGSREPSPDGLGPAGFDPSRWEIWAAAVLSRDANGATCLWLQGGLTEAEALGKTITRVPDGSTIIAKHVQIVASYCDSDRNPEGEKPQALSAEHESAGPKDIAP